MKLEADGFTTLLFITFLILKLTHVINWSWLWVTSPIWIPLTLTLILFLIVWTIKILR